MVRRLRVFLSAPFWLAAFACHITATLLMLAAAAVEGCELGEAGR